MRKGKELVAFVTSQFLPKKLEHPDARGRQRACSAYACALFQWASQVRVIATLIEGSTGKKVRLSQRLPRETVHMTRILRKSI